MREADAQYLATCCGAEPVALGPVADQLGDKRLLIAAEGALQYIPFAALPAPNATGREPSARELPVPLMVDHEIVNLPSASALAALRRETIARRPAPRTVALLADPVFELDDPRVPLEVRKAAPARARRPAMADLGRALRDVGINTMGSASRVCSRRARKRKRSPLSLRRTPP